MKTINKSVLILFLNFIFLIKYITCLGQCSNAINTISTDWNNPLSLNTWNWTQNYFDVYLIGSGLNSIHMC